MVTAMSTFVLVHGAMHGGWSWTKVRSLLHAQGHRVFTPTLTGQGERKHLLTRDVGVDTHVEDIVNTLEFEDLSDVVLVLHSYSGVLAGPLADRVGDRLEHVVAAGAFLTDPGESLLDVEPSETAQAYIRLAEQEGDGWRLPATDRFLDQWGITGPELRAFVAPRLTDFPLRCQTDTIEYREDSLAELRRTYIEHTNPPLTSLATSIDRARSSGWTMREIACGHDMMLADPEGTVSLLLDL
jgi:pimeloyl-ACP methyl ester carboxylesterase